MKLKNLSLQPSVLAAELVGTFLLTTVALVTQGNLLIVGFTLVVLVLSIGAVSGAHVNPAVTFGLWSAKKLETLKVPFYWAMQFAGALLALLLVQWFKGGSFGLAFDINQFDSRLVVAEIAGTAAFAFAIGSAIQYKLNEGAKAVAIGLGLLVGIAVGGGLIGQAAQSSDLLKNVKDGETLRVSQVDGATLNPAVALASAEKDSQSSLQSFMGEEKEQTTKTPASRFTWESIIGTLVGGAIGVNLAVALSGVNPFKADKKAAVKAKVTKVFKKGKK